MSDLDALRGLASLLRNPLDAHHQPLHMIKTPPMSSKQAAREVGKAREAAEAKEQQVHQLLQDLRCVGSGGSRWLVV